MSEQIKTYNYIFVASTDDGESVDDSSKNDVAYSDQVLN